MKHHHRSRALRGVLLGVALAVPLLTSTADAAPDRITQGEAVAHFNAGLTGGQVIRLGNGAPAVVNAGPASYFDAGIRPFPGGPWDGASFCVDDWHVFVIGYFDGGDKSFTHQDAVASLAGVEFDWVLDGNSLATTERTPIKRYLASETFGLENAFGFQDGSFSAPGDLTVGSHTLEVVITDSVFGDDTLGITFNIDDTGTGACVQAGALRAGELTDQPDPTLRREAPYKREVFEDLGINVNIGELRCVDYNKPSTDGSGRQYAMGGVI